MKASRPELAGVKSNQNMVTLLERNVVFHKTDQHIDECPVELDRKMIRSLEFIGMAKEKYPSKKVLGFFCETLAKNRG